ncbi:MAG: hypothetical protein HQK81_03605 [Desulfovibrionaceae bacterium]|nr:hypothetical protein [Desulfovibrionaceae bacterium]MBF0513128.1 hypothetical protein [Desulfovibrionaceae bacterium]
MPRDTRILPILSGPAALSFYAAFAFAAFCLIGITGPGLFYDELHQACASFLYLDNTLTNVPFSYLIGKIPVLNMGYSGAIKSLVYGAYLVIFKEFSVLSWRFFGVFFVSLGLFAAVLMMIRRQGIVPAAIFIALFFTDTDIYLSTRLDWGPTALALALRLVFIAVWINGERVASSRSSLTFWLGLIFSLSVFEKLSSVVLLAPLLCIVLSKTTRFNLRHVRSAFWGALAGSLPLVIINIHSYVTRNNLVSLGGVSVIAPGNFVNFAAQYLNLGSGASFFIHVYDLERPAWVVSGALAFTCALLIISAAVTFAFRRYDTQAKIGFISLVSYLAIGILFYYFPQRTWAHHWIVGTPFQYVAMAMTMGFLWRCSFLLERITFIRTFFSLIIFIFIIFRIAGLVQFIYVGSQNQYGKRWNQEYTELGIFSSKHAREAFFVASDWGVGTQIACFTSCAPGIVYEVFGQDKKELQTQLEAIMDQTAKNIMYVVRPVKPIINNFEANVSFVEDFIAGRDGWTEVSLPNDVPRKAISIRKYVRKNTPSSEILNRPSK